MKSPLLLSGIVLLTLLSACEVAPMEENVEEMEENEIEEIEEETTESSVDAAMGDVYTEFSQESYDALLGQKAFALFFHAAWCPVCIGMEEDILSNLSGFPEGTQILKVDYDTETALKETYGIKSQSVVVLINSAGEVEATLAAPSAATLQEEFAKLLQ